MPLETQVQHFMYLHIYVPYLLSEFIPLCSTKTWPFVQNCITPLGGRHQFSRRKQILVSYLFWYRSSCTTYIYICIQFYIWKNHYNYCVFCKNVACMVKVAIHTVWKIILFFNMKPESVYLSESYFEEESKVKTQDAVHLPHTQQSEHHFLLHLTRQIISYSHMAKKYMACSAWPCVQGSHLPLGCVRKQFSIWSCVWASHILIGLVCKDAQFCPGNLHVLGHVCEVAMFCLGM